MSIFQIQEKVNIDLFINFFSKTYDGTVLYCFVLYCNVLYFTVLYCSILYCTVLYSTGIIEYRVVAKVSLGSLPPKDLSANS